MRSKLFVWIPIFALAMASSQLGDSAVAAEDERKSVMNTVANFYTALNEMFTGELDRMKEVWSHADDVTYMGPGGGFKVGWDQVLKDWKTQAALKLGGEVAPTDMRITVGKDLAVVSNYENGENTNANGVIQKLSIRATNVFRKEHGKWKMIGHHTDLLPFLKTSH